VEVADQRGVAPPVKPETAPQAVLLPLLARAEASQRLVLQATAA